MEFKDRLRQLRKEANLTQAELAKRLNYGYTAIANYESGRTTPSAQNLCKIADLFHVSVDYLVGRSNRCCPLSEHEDVQIAFLNQLRKHQTPLQLADLYILDFLYSTFCEMTRFNIITDKQHFLQIMEEIQKNLF